MAIDGLALFAATATLGIGFFSGVSEAQLFLEARYVHLSQFFRAAVDRHRAEFKTDIVRSVPVGGALVPVRDPAGGWRRRGLEFSLNGLGGAAPSLFDGGLTRRRSAGLYYFEEWPRSLYGDFYWPRTVPLWSSYRAVRRWAKGAAQREGDEGREERHVGKAGEHAARMLWHMWVWRRLMTLKWLGIVMTLASSIGAILWAGGHRF
ncbi:MAG: hypothetical protein ABR562_00050 [Thermoplasmatota archaeon]|nr:hypothetical protein [Halobacteriales archaeon]